MAGPVHAGQGAAGSRREGARRGSEDPGRSRAQGASGRAGHRARDQFAGRVRALRPRRQREVGPDYQGSRHQRRLSLATESMRDVPVPVPEQTELWGSDAIAAMLRALDIPYLSLNPGASYRGLHDSIVNYLGNERPQM